MDYISHLILCSVLSVTLVSSDLNIHVKLNNIYYLNNLKDVAFDNFIFFTTKNQKFLILIFKLDKINNIIK